MFRYRAYGLDIRSELALPELLAQEGEGSAQGKEVLFRYGAIQDVDPAEDGHSRTIRATGDQVTLYWRDVGYFEIRDGREVIVAPLPGVDAPLVRLYLLGATLAVLLHLRGDVVVMHASAVAISGAAALFVGPNGAGKSLLAAVLHARGHQLLADDIAAVVARDQRSAVLPGFPHFRLWPDSAAELGLAPEELPFLRQGVDKRGYRITTGFAEEACPLACVYMLGSGSQVKIEPLAAREALMALLPHWYGARLGRQLLEALGLERHFLNCAALARKLPVCALTRPSGQLSVQESADLVERHVANTLNQVLLGSTG